jgi:phytoene synthase
MCAEIYGYRDHHTPRFAHDLAVALYLSDLLRDLRANLARGRVYIPQEDLDRFSLTVTDLNQPQTSDRARELFLFEAQRIHGLLTKAFNRLVEADRHSQRPNLILASIYRALLDEIEHDGFRLLEHRIELTPLRKLWIAWRTSMRERH